MMSVHNVYMHVNFTQYSHSFVHVPLTSALDPLLWKTVCDCLYLLKPWHLQPNRRYRDHQGALLTSLVPKCCPSSCQHICSSEITLRRHDTPPPHLPGPSRLIYHSVGDFNVEKLRHVQKAHVNHLPLHTHTPPPLPSLPHSHTADNLSVVFIVS